MRTFFVSLAPLWAALALGCSGTSIGNPPGAQIKLGVAGRSEPLPGQLQIGGGITIDRAWIALEDMDLRNGGTCTGEDDMDYDAPGPIAADLLTGEVYPARPEWLRPGNETYCALQAKLDRAAAPIPNAPVELADHSVFMTGTRSDAMPFEVRSDISQQMELGPSAGEFVFGTGPKGMLIVFDLAEWLDPALLSAADVSNAVILIDKDNNTDIANDLEDRIPQSATLFRDGNRDGMLNENDGNDAISD